MIEDSRSLHVRKATAFPLTIFLYPEYAPPMNDLFQTYGEAHSRGSDGSEASGRCRTEAADTADTAENAAKRRQRPRTEHMSQLVESPQREQLMRGYGDWLV